MRIWSIVLVIMLGLSATASSHAQEMEEGRLTVYGKVRSFAQTDRARVTFQIKGVGKSLKAAFADAESRIETVASRLTDIGMDRESLATSFFESGENYGDKAFLSSKKDFRAKMTASISTEQLELMKDIIIILSESEVEAIRDVSFEITDYADLREQALKKATEKAEDKAALACEQLGVTCGRVLEFEELRPAQPGQALNRTRRLYTPFNAPVFAANDILSQSAGEPAAIFPEELRFDSEVRIVFALEDASTPTPSHDQP